MEKNINIKSLIQNLNKEKIKDYLYPAIFFLVFSIFIIFAIRPSLITVFKLIKQERELSEKNKKYQDAVDYVSMNLSVLESLRDRMYLLDESFPNTPQVNKIIEDVYNSGKETNVRLSSLDLIKPIEYSLVRKAVINEIGINVEAEGDFEDLMSFINTIREQRRIKTIKSLELVSNNKISTESGTLNIKLQIEGYFL